MGLFDKLLRKKIPRIQQQHSASYIKSSWSKELWDTVGVKPTKFTVASDSEAHLFHSTDLGYTLYTKNIGQGSVLTVGDRIPLACMFDAHWLTLNKEKIGYLFTSNFQVVNRGGYIMTYMNNRAGKASAVEVLVKTDTLVIYHYPNHGTLVVSPHIGQDVQTILSEQ